MLCIHRAPLPVKKNLANVSVSLYFMLLTVITRHHEQKTQYSPTICTVIGVFVSSLKDYITPMAVSSGWKVVVTSHCEVLLRAVLEALLFNGCLVKTPTL